MDAEERYMWISLKKLKTSKEKMLKSYVDQKDQYNYTYERGC
jgi:hypothetical protein